MEELEIVSTPPPEEQCFICCRNTCLKSVSGDDGFKEEGRLQISSQLRVILLLRKILGIPQDVIVSLLKAVGDFAKWGILLCSRCLTVLKEAEFVHKRLLKYHADFQELGRELRSMLSHSEGETFSSKPVEEEAGNLEADKDRRRKRGRPKRHQITSKSESIDVLSELRQHFFEGKRAGTLDVSSPQALFLTKRKGTVLNEIVTSQPVLLKIAVSNVEQDRLARDECNRNEDLDEGIRYNAPTKFVKAKRPKNVSWASTKVSISDDDENISDKHALENSADDEVSGGGVRYLRMQIKSEPKDPTQATHDECNTLEDNEDMHSPLNDRCSSPEWEPPGHENTGEPNELVSNAEDQNVTDEDSDYAPTKPNRKLSSKKPKKRNRSEIVARNRARRAILSDSCAKVPLEVDSEPLSEGNRFKCPTCDKLYKRKLDCRVHILRDHFDDPLPFHCHVCDSKRFSEEKRFRAHMFRFHIGVPSPYDHDYNPDLHSADHLKRKVVEDNTWQLSNAANEETGDRMNDIKADASGTPILPEDILAKFKNGPHGGFPCRKCKRKFSSEMLRDAHEKRMHEGNENPFSCDLCQRSFFRRSLLFKHVVINHFSNKHVCSYCGSRFADKNLLEGHMRRIHLGESNPFECRICSRRFPRRVNLFEHMSKTHGIRTPGSTGKKIPGRLIDVPRIIRPSVPRPEGTKFECWICSSGDKPMVFETHEENEEHVQTMHKKTSFMCPEDDCEKQYSSEANLEKHIAKCHKNKTDDEPLKYDCTECYQTFRNQSLLNTHQTKKHGNYTFICDICGQQFKAPNYLEHHQRQRHHKELNIKPHKCNQCGKIMNTERSLEHHIKLKHTKETRFKCKECDFGCMFAMSLQRHMEVRHLKLSNALCPVCSRGFATQFYLTRHMRIHTGEKPFKCKVCGKAFSDRPTFNRHVEAHKGKIHECPLPTCKKQYRTRHAFRIHLKQHQKKGIMVEIPEIYYDNDDQEAENENSNNGSTQAEGSLSSGSVLPDIPFLERELKLDLGESNTPAIERGSTSSSEVALQNDPLGPGNDTPPVLRPEVVDFHIPNMPEYSLPL